MIGVASSPPIPDLHRHSAPDLHRHSAARDSAVPGSGNARPVSPPEARDSSGWRGCALRLGTSRWRHLPYLILLVGGTLFLITEALLNHRALGTGYDLGIYDQVVWNMAHGRPFATTLVYETNGYYDHLEPVLALISPLYWLWPDVRVLLVLQAVALALGSLPIYLYARRRLGEFGPEFALLALLPAAAYLVYPPLHSANLNDFHEVALLPALIGFALYGLLTGRRRLMFLSLGLCLLVKEDLTVTLLVFSLYILLLKPAGFRRRDGVWMGALALAWGMLILNVLYPAMTHGMSYPFVERRYSWLGDSPATALRNLVTQPGLAAAHIFQPPKLVFLLRLFAPLLFLPVLGWPVISLALPVLAYLMMSDYQPQWSVQSYYNPPLLAFLFFAMIGAVMWLGRQAARLGLSARVVVAALLIGVTIAVGYSYYAVAPGPGSRPFQHNGFAVTPRVEAARELLAQVPTTASVSTVWPLVPYLSQRERIYTVLARPVQPPEYMLLEESPGAQGAPIYPYAAPPGWPPVYYEYQPVAASGPFRLLAYGRAVKMVPLVEPQPRSVPLSLAAYAWLDGPDPGEAPVVQPGESTRTGTAAALRLLLAWRRTGPLDRRFAMFVHLLPECGPEAANGLPRIIAQSGHEPGDGQWPTTFWETWTNPSIVLDEQRIEIPADAEAGTYCAWAGVFDTATGERLTLGGPGRTLALVGPVTVAR
jgi:uncharacterized membrane protein